MSLIVNTSPDLSLLSVEVTYDLSGVSPLVSLTNLSQGPNLANVDYYFTVQSPTLTYIHQGSFSPPDESGVWTTSVLSNPWPRPFNNIEFGIYKFQVFARDSNGNIFEAPIQTVQICRPNGNLPTSQNPYGLGQLIVQTKCDQARIYFQDVTNTSYQGLSGNKLSATLRVNFPMDNTGHVPTPFQIGFFSSAMVPITYSGKGYQFLFTSIWEYDLGDQSFVRIKYLKNDVFGVWCGIDLMPLICEYQKLIASIEDGSCADSESAQRKLMLINPKFSLVMIGMMQPLTGVDVPTLIQEIEEIGGFDCDCCNVATGVLPQGTNAFEGYTFSVVPIGGDVNGQFVVNGYNIQLQLEDISYIFKICDSSPAQTTAFSVVPSLSSDGYTKTYCLNVEMDQLAQDILTVIQNDAGLVNFFNSLIVNAGGNFQLVVDGKCIFTTASAYNYQFTLSNIPAASDPQTYAVFNGFTLNSGNVNDNFVFFMGTLPDLQGQLNSLGLGTFAVSAAGANSVLITSNANPTNILTLNYTNSLGNQADAAMDKTTSGFVQLSANQVVQNIINYLCELDDSQVVTSQEYEICYINEDGEKVVETIAAGTSLTSFLASLTTRGCTTIDYIVSLGAVNCATIKEQFPSSDEVMEANDYFLGTKQGECARILPVEAFLYMLQYGFYSQEIKTAFCALVNTCGAGSPCAPYEVFYAVVEDGSPEEKNLVITFDHPEAVSNTIRYARIDNIGTTGPADPVWITIPGVLPGASPYTISNVVNGQYRVCITPVYSDGRACEETCYDTEPCPVVTAFNAIYNGTNIVITYTAGGSPAVSYVKWILNYPNGGFASEVVEANEDPITITPPEEVFGTFYATMKGVCDPDTGYESAASAPATFEIPETSP